MTAINISKTGSWTFPKCLTHDEVSSISKNIWDKCPSKGNWELDLSEVAEMDSAFLALLLEALRQSLARKLNLQIKGLSENATALLKVYGVYSLFEKSLI